MPIFFPTDLYNDVVDIDSSVHDIFHPIVASTSVFIVSATADRFPSTTDTARNNVDSTTVEADGPSTSSPTSTTSTFSIPTTTSTTAVLTTSQTLATVVTSSSAPSSAPTVGITSDASTSSTSKSGPGSAGIGVLVTILILAVCAGAFWFIRRKHIRARQKRRTTWVRSPIQEFVENDMEANMKRDGRFDTLDINEKEPVEFQDYSIMPPAQVNLPVTPPALHAAGYAPPRMPSPPPVTVTSPGAYSPVPIGVQAPSVGGVDDRLVSATSFSPVAVAAPSIFTPVFSTPVSSTITSGTLVYVARTFTPTLPDELSIQTGEQIRVITRFDDGWAHVERMRSGAGVESGVVPVECLEPITAPSARSAPGLSQEAVEGWRLSKRKSSLIPAGPAQY